MNKKGVEAVVKIIIWIVFFIIALASIYKLVKYLGA